MAAPKETWSAKALRIAAHYLDDPDRWARQDKYGKGLTACQREVEPDFLAGDTSGKRMVLVSRAVAKLQADLDANGIERTVVSSRRARADAELAQRLEAEREQDAGCSPQRAPDRFDETGELLGGGTVADSREILTSAVSKTVLLYYCTHGCSGTYYSNSTRCV